MRLIGSMLEGGCTPEKNGLAIRVKIGGDDGRSGKCGYESLVLKY